MNKVKIFLQDSIVEIKDKITWPPYNELQSNAVLVIVASLIFALVVGMMDVVFEKSMTWFYQSF